MHDTLPVRLGKAGAKLTHNGDGVGSRKRTAASDQITQRLAFHVLHRDVRRVVDASEIVYAADVLVRDLPRQEQLVLEALGDLGIVRELLAQHLQRNDRSRFPVACLAHHSHAAVTQIAEYLVTVGGLRNVGTGHSAIQVATCSVISKHAQRAGQWQAWLTSLRARLYAPARHRCTVGQADRAVRR